MATNDPLGKKHATVTQTSSQPDRLGTGAANGISGSTSFDWRDGDLAPQYNKHLRGFEGIKRTGMTAGKQAQGYDGPGKPGSASPREARTSNASFDRSIYQTLVKSMHEGK